MSLNQNAKFQDSSVKITVVTICLNAGKKIIKTIESVLSQTYANIEYIIIDGDSENETKDIIYNFENSVSSIISEKDYGISHAFNKGVLRSHGDVIVFLNAGDYFLTKDVVERYIKDLRDNPVDIIFYKAHMKNGFYMPDEKYRDNEEIIWKKSMVPHQTAFVKKEVFEYIGLFNPCLLIRMDYDFFSRAFVNGISYKYLPRVIVEYDTYGISMRENNIWRFLFEELRINQFYGRHNSALLKLKFLRRYLQKIVKGYI